MKKTGRRSWTGNRKMRILISKMLVSLTRLGTEKCSIIGLSIDWGSLEFPHRKITGTGSTWTRADFISLFITALSDIFLAPQLGSSLSP